MNIPFKQSLNTSSKATGISKTDGEHCMENRLSRPYETLNLKEVSVVLEKCDALLLGTNLRNNSNFKRAFISQSSSSSDSEDIIPLSHFKQNTTSNINKSSSNEYHKIVNYVSSIHSENVTTQLSEKQIKLPSHFGTKTGDVKFSEDVAFRVNKTIMQDNGPLRYTGQLPSKFKPSHEKITQTQKSDSLVNMHYKVNCLPEIIVISDDEEEKISSSQSFTKRVNYGEQESFNVSDVKRSTFYTVHKQSCEKGFNKCDLTGTVRMQNSDERSNFSSKIENLQINNLSPMLKTETILQDGNDENDETCFDDTSYDDNVSYENTYPLTNNDLFSRIKWMDDGDVMHESSPLEVKNSEVSSDSDNHTLSSVGSVSSLSTSDYSTLDKVCNSVKKPFVYVIPLCKQVNKVSNGNLLKISNEQSTFTKVQQKNTSEYIGSNKDKQEKEIVEYESSSIGNYDKNDLPQHEANFIMNNRKIIFNDDRENVSTEAIGKDNDDELDSGNTCNKTYFGNSHDYFKDYIQTDDTVDKELSHSTLNDVKLDASKSVHSRIETVNEFFPVLSESDESQESFLDVKKCSRSSDDTNIYSNKSTPLNGKPFNYVFPIIKQDMSKSYKVQKLHSVLLTEPLPVSYRPKKIRGREEWFTDHYTDDSCKRSKGLSIDNNCQLDNVNAYDMCNEGDETSRMMKKKHPNSRVTKEQVIQGNGKNSIHTVSKVTNYCSNLNNQTKSFNKKISEKKRLKKSVCSRFSAVETPSRKKEPIIIKLKPKLKTSKGNKSTNYSHKWLADYKIPKKVLSMKTSKKKVKRKRQKKKNKQKEISTEGLMTVVCGTVPLSENLQHKDVHMGNNSHSILTKRNSEANNNSYFEGMMQEHNVDMINISAASNDSSGRMHIPNIKHAQYLIDNSLSSTSVNSNVTISEAAKTTDDETLLKFLQWNVNWLNQQKLMSMPPPVLGDAQISKVGLSYLDYDSYYKTYSALLWLNTWALIYEAWLNRIFCMQLSCAITSYEAHENFIILNCETVTDDEKIKNGFTEGIFLTIRWPLYDKNCKTTMFRAFGYVYECKSRILASESLLSSSLINKFTDDKNKPYLLQFKIKTRCAHQLQMDNINLNEFINIRTLFYLKPTLQKFEALKNVKSSMLLNNILRPYNNTCIQTCPSDQKLIAVGCYNQLQQDAILSIADSVLKQYTPQILVLQGLPGTGKTNVLFGILQQLYQQKRDGYPILVLAPSNAAVDEIGRRILKQKSRIKNCILSKIQFIRIGHIDRIHAELKDYCLEKLIENSIQHQENIIKDLDNSISEIEAKLNNIKIQIATLKEQGSFEDLKFQEQQLAACHCQIAQYHLQKSKVRQNRSRTKDELQIDALKKADIVLSTLNCCRQGLLESVFNNECTNSPINFSCCIVDDATQCTEPELLVPLFYKISKLVLIGDPYQFPITITSEVAKQKGYELSLFHRIHHYFEQVPNGSPFVTLTEQYRMHPEISAFPAEYLYSEKLLTSPRLMNVYHSFPLKPYIVFDICNESDENRNLNVNSPSIQFVSAVVNILQKELQDRYSKGIIIPRAEQQYIYLDQLSKLNCSIEVNIADAFLGRSKDVVIISCLGIQQNKGKTELSNKLRINVCLTRARHSLIICGCLKTMEEDLHWKPLIDNARERNLIVSINSENQNLDLLQVLRKSKK